MGEERKQSPLIARCECCGRTLGMMALVERIVRDGYEDTSLICDRARAYNADITNKQVYNALNGLVRYGRVRHRGYGSYESVR